MATGYGDGTYGADEYGGVLHPFSGTETVDSWANFLRESKVPAEKPHDVSANTNRWLNRGRTR